MRIQFSRVLLYVTSIIIMGLLLNTSLIYADSTEYDDYSEQHTYPNEILKEHITVYSKDGHYDVEDVQNSINILEKLPPHMFEIIKIRNIQIYFIDFPLPDLEGLEYLDERKEVIGYPEGSTYRDDVFGYYIGGDLKKAVVRTDEDVKVSRSPSTTLHEIGHALSFGDGFNDYFLTEEFTMAHTDEKPSLFPDNDYFDIRSEYFAEIFSYYFFNDEQRDELRKKAPKSFEYLERFVKYPFYVSENTVDEVVLKWAEIEDAVSYEVVRDGAVIDNVVDTTYKDNDYDDYIHTYEINALDQNGNQVFKFHKETTETNLYDRNLIQLEEETKQEAEEWEKEMENTTTLEDILEKFNIPSSFLPIIFWAMMISILFILPVTVVVVIYIFVKRKRKQRSL